MSYPHEAYAGYFPGISSFAEGYAIQARESYNRAAMAFGHAALKVVLLPEMKFKRVFQDLAHAELFAKAAMGHAEHAARAVLEERTTEAWERHVAAAKRLGVLAARCSARIKRTFAAQPWQ